MKSSLAQLTSIEGIASLALGALLLTGTLIAFGRNSRALGSRGNQQWRTIEQPKAPGEPFETELKVKGNKISAGESFEDNDDDWLKDIEIKFVNRFDKPIVFINLSLCFRDLPSTMPRPVVYNIHIGQLPNEKRHVSGPILLIKNDFAMIKLPDTAYENLKQFFSGTGIAVGTLTKVQIDIGQIAFSDGSQWQFGAFYEPDPYNPGKLREVKN